MIKKVFLKILVLGTLLILFNFIYTKYFFESDIQKYSGIINLVWEMPQETDILYLGESSNTTFKNTDSDKRSISEMLTDYYPNSTIYDITKPASHAGIYKELLRKIEKPNQIKTLIVTLNLRSFNAQWIHSDAELSLQKSLVLLRDNPPLINRIMLSFKDYDNRTMDLRQHDIKKQWRKDLFIGFDNLPFKNVIEWDNWMADNERLNKPKRDLACHYIKAYGFQIDFSENPRIKDFNEIIKMAKQQDWNLMFNLMAENTDKAKDLVGEDLVLMMNENAKKLIEYYEAKGVTVVNNLNSIKDEQFIDQDWTTEHYAERGRKTIARNVAFELKKWHKIDEGLK